MLGFQGKITVLEQICILLLNPHSVWILVSVLALLGVFALTQAQDQCAALAGNCVKDFAASASLTLDFKGTPIFFKASATGNDFDSICGFVDFEIRNSFSETACCLFSETLENAKPKRENKSACQR